jgi:hypothetical protein
MGRGQHADTFEYGERMRNVLVTEVMMQRFQIEFRGKARNHEKRLQLRRKVQRVRLPPVVQRLLAHAIARQQADPLTFVPYGHGKHPVNLRGQLLAMLLPEVREHLGVGMRSKLVAAFEEKGTNVRKVVQLSVLCGHDAAVLVLERLPAAGHVDDAQARRSYREVITADDVLVVGAAVMERRKHRGHCVAVTVTKESGYAAHGRWI